MNEAKLVITHQKSQRWYLTVMVLAVSVLIGIFILGRYFALSDLRNTKSRLTESLTELSKSQSESENMKEKLVMKHK